MWGTAEAGTAEFHWEIIFQLQPDLRVLKELGGLVV